MYGFYSHMLSLSLRLCLQPFSANKRCIWGNIVTRRVALSDSTARHARHDKHDRCDSHDTCSGASPLRGWGGHVHFTFSRSYSRDSCKLEAQKTKLVHASTTASSWSVVLEQARFDTPVTKRSTTRHFVLVVSWRDVTSQVEFWLHRKNMK